MCVEREEKYLRFSTGMKELLVIVSTRIVMVKFKLVRIYLRVMIKRFRPCVKI